MNRTEGVLPGETAESILAGIRKLSGPIALQDFQRDVEQELVSQGAQSAGTEGPGWDEGVARFFGGEHGPAAQGRRLRAKGDGHPCEDELRQEAWDIMDERGVLEPDFVKRMLVDDPEYGQYLYDNFLMYRTSEDALYGRSCGRWERVVVPEPLLPCKWHCEPMGGLPRPDVPTPEIFTSFTIVKCPHTWVPTFNADCWEDAGEGRIGDDDCGCGPPVRPPRVCLNVLPSDAPELFEFQCRGYGPATCGPAEELLQEAWAWLYLNQDLVQFIVCLVTGNADHARCVREKVNGTQVVRFHLDTNSRKDPGFHAHGSHRMGSGPDMVGDYITPWFNASTLEAKVCIEMDLAATLLHELLHTCDPGDLYREPATSAGGECEPSYMIENSFRYALSVRYPCVLEERNAGMELACSGWDDRLWMCDKVSLPEGSNCLK